MRTYWSWWNAAAGMAFLPWAVFWYTTMPTATLAPIVTEARNCVRVAGE